MRSQQRNIGSRFVSRRQSGRVGRIGLCVAGAILSSFSADRAWASDSVRTETQHVQSMHLLTSNTGWAASQKRLQLTSDAGQHWTDITPPGKNLGNIDGVFFLNDLQGWVVNSITASAGQGAAAFIVSSTSDGGKTWTSKPLTVPSLEGGIPISVSFADVQHGWMMLRLPSGSNFSRGLLLATADGGSSWTVLPKPPIGDAIEFVSQSSGWLAGGVAHDRLYVTRDGGNSWQRQYVVSPDSAVTPIYQLPAFHNDHDGELAVVVGSTSASHLTVYDTHDGGASWDGRVTVPLSADASIAGGAVTSIVDASTLFIAPRSREGFTAVANGVQSTVPQFFSRLSSGEAVTAMSFKDDRQGWVLVAGGHCDNGKSSCHQESSLLTTSDGGSTLSDITPPVIGGNAISSGGVEPDVVVTSTVEGFDQCAAGTVSQMQAWWTNTPWSYANIYIGGSNMGCSQNNLNAGWVSSIFAQGWTGLIPTWVGLQAPDSSCTSCGEMSSDTATATQQGIDEADSATSAANALGLTPPTIIYYDMEQYGDSPSAAVQAFVEGWVTELHANGNQAGVYGSGANAAADWAVIANPPDAVWIADWNGSTSVYGLYDLPDDLWSNNQRLHQYEGGHDETWGGVTFNIDSDSADGPIADQ
jgi:photosystem II stability/assembly factor-like uncharacterized protein